MDFFHNNHNLYGLYIFAQGINDLDENGSYDPNNDEIAGQAVAYAMIWREPFPTEGGGTRDKSMLKFFKRLDE